MTLQPFVLPDIRSLASALRAKLCRMPVGFSPTRSPFAATSPQVRPAPMLAHWRVCPTTGQLVQHWDHADPQDPQRRNVSSLVQASLMLSLYVSARTA
ncbi:hypothetical protein ACQRBV_20950 [Pseudomonas sp. R11F]|uniref:Uncharacterized protein n=1 Tax=Pseudomonas palleroniana TaxID=191390 RepID=A0A1H5NY47_9PSED|nr:MULTISPECIES: hypothetical protein [Pseudomonas]AVE04005.1 hypothetical protein CYL20_05405 [Pseudomonas palleroniana]KAB0568984.1 hypothetical protein F7R03_05270 [Pseudomonas palleroniana]NCE83560.1 hypothetical protein [Pseudomonas sp. Q1]PTC22426.1 hypothetical protein C9383_23430 [Pseudomonas palleroniana]UOP10507.1 hypothetical protein LDL65_26080 [Pseudomonas palleroniana]